MENKIMVSSYKDTYSKESIDVPFIEFIKGIKEGKWQDQVLDTRVKLSKTEDKKERGKIKARNVIFRVSGSFSGQSDDSIRKHSGFIAIDIDNIDNANTAKDIIKSDPFLYAAFVSISSNGLCLIFRIDGTRHLDAFEGLAKYLYDTYQFIVDQSCKNVSRARFVSYDPYLYINEDAPVFKKYLPKPKARKVNKIVYVESDFDKIINEMYSRGINVCEEYSDWIAIAYGIASEHGDSTRGLQYFQTLSSMSSKYNEKDSEKQYKSCCKTLSNEKKKQSSINLIYWHAKQNGIELYSQETKEVIRSASSQHKNGVSRDSIANSLEKHSEIPKEISLPIIDQVVVKGIEHESENIIEDILFFLQPFGLKKNLITRNVELNGRPLDDSDINTLFIECKSIFDKVTKDLVCSVIFSNKIQQYNPIKDFFTSNKGEVDDNLPNLNMLLKSINTDTVNYEKWVTKWLVSIVSSAFGNYSPLVLVFSGSTQGTGKTHWMRYLLPKKLRYLFAESDMDNGKDDEILMTKKLIILDDEYGGKSKKEEKKLKKITAKEFINVREPYGRVSVDLRRLAVFCGTSNDNQILSDPTGNRRVLPINILSLNHKMYNECDKEALWHELYSLYKSGYDCTVLENEIKELAENTEMFNASTPEEELLFTKLKNPESSFTGEWMTVTEIIRFITIDTKYVFSNVRMGLLLSKYNFEKTRKKRDGNSVVVYHVQKTEENSPDNAEFKQDEAPF